MLPDGGGRPGREDDEVGAAARFAGIIIATGLVFVVGAVWWAGSCENASATVACGRPYRALLAASGPAIFGGGGLRAFLRTYRVWQARGTWWAWQGVGWLLMSLMLIVLIMSAVPISGVG